MKKNATIYFKKHGNYNNMFAEISLVNGETITIQIKPSFYNSKLVYKLQKQIAVEKDEK